MKKIKGVFFDLGGTLRIAENVPEHQEKAKRRMAELAGYEDADAFIDMVEQRYLPYRDWALGEMKESSDFELWHKWLLPEMDEEKVRELKEDLSEELEEYSRYEEQLKKILRQIVSGGAKFTWEN